LNFDFGKNLVELKDRFKEYERLYRELVGRVGTGHISDAVRRERVMSGVPEPLRQHLQLCASRATTYDEVRTIVSEFLRVRFPTDPFDLKVPKGGKKARGPDDMDVDAITKMLNAFQFANNKKGDKKGKKGDGKGKKGDGKGKKGDGKGKHKGDNNDLCTNCWKTGHKKDACFRLGRAGYPLPKPSHLNEVDGAASSSGASSSSGSSMPTSAAALAAAAASGRKKKTKTIETIIEMSSSESDDEDDDDEDDGHYVSAFTRADTDDEDDEPQQRQSTARSSPSVSRKSSSLSFLSVGRALWLFILVILSTCLSATQTGIMSMTTTTTSMMTGGITEWILVDSGAYICACPKEWHAEIPITNVDNVREAAKHAAGKALTI